MKKTPSIHPATTMGKLSLALCLSALIVTTACSQGDAGHGELVKSTKSNAGHWELVKSTNRVNGRSECSLVAVSGKLYLIGNDGPVEPVEVFDPKTDTWTKKAMAPMVMHHFQAVALGEKIYVLDAFYDGGFPSQSPMPNAYCYDTKTDAWQKLAEIPAKRRRAGAGEAVHDGKLYLVCGITHGHSSGTNSMFDEYDPATDTWKALPDAPHIRDHSMAVVVGDKLYSVGGRNTSFRDPENRITFFSQTVLDVDCYDFKTRTWSTLAAKLPLGTGGGTAVNLDDKIYYIGGERATATERNQPRKDVYCLDPSTSNEWAKVADLNLARNGVGGTVLNHKVYIAGGAGGPGGPGGLGGPDRGPGRPGGFDGGPGGPGGPGGFGGGPGGPGNFDGGPGGPGGGSAIRQVMMRMFGRNPQALRRSLEANLKADPPAWAAIQTGTAELVKLSGDVGKADPPKGSKESWNKLAGGLIATAKDLDKAAQAKNLADVRTANESIGKMCNACHDQHKGGGGPGGFGPRGPGGFDGPGGPGGADRGPGGPGGFDFGPGGPPDDNGPGRPEQPNRKSSNDKSPGGKQPNQGPPNRRPPGMGPGGGGDIGLEVFTQS